MAFQYHCSSSPNSDTEAERDPKHFYKSEIESHEAQSGKWWDAKGTMRALHAMNKLRLPLVKKGLQVTKRIDLAQAASSNFLSGVKILDAGCGGGILSEALAKVGAEVTGVDPSEGLIAVAREHAQLLNVTPPKYVCNTIENHSEQFPELYDAVIASEVIEHVPNKESFLEACVAALKPGGSLFVTTPNRTSLSWLGAIVVCEDILRMVPRGFHSWDQFIHHKDLKKLITSLGCDVKKIQGMMYDPLMNKWTWWFFTSFVYAVHSVKKNSTD